MVGLVREPHTARTANEGTSLWGAALNGEISLASWAHGTHPGHPELPDTMPELGGAGVWDARHAQRWGLDWHRNQGVELTFVSRGRLPFACDGQDWDLGAGSLTVTRPWQEHRLGAPTVPASRIVWLILDVDARYPDEPWQWPKWLLFAQQDLSRLEQLLRENPRAVFKGNALARSQFERLATVLAKPGDAGTATRLAIVVNELLLAVLESIEADAAAAVEGDSERVLSPAGSRAGVEQFLEQLNSEIAYPWTLAEMAESCGLARTQFSAHCLALTNQSPMQYLQRIRIQAAKDMLRADSHRTVTEIAHLCGFSTSQYFATTFRQLVGVSPSEYRNRASSEMPEPA